MSWVKNATGGPNGGPCLEVAADSADHSAIQWFEKQATNGEQFYYAFEVRPTADYDGPFLVAMRLIGTDGKPLSGGDQVVTYANGTLTKGSWQIIEGDLTLTHGSVIAAVRPGVAITSAATTGSLRVVECHASRMERGATVGATAGSNLKDSGGNVLDDADIKNLTWSTVTTGTTLVNGQGVITAGGETYTLPGSPPVGARVGFRDRDKVWDSSPVTVNRNGEDIEGTADDIQLDSVGLVGLTVFFIYDGGSVGWRLSSGV